MVSKYRLQNFSLPDSFIYYITKNPSTSKIYQKLIQSCKYFFFKNPIIIIHCLEFDAENDQWNICVGCDSMKRKLIHKKIDVLNVIPSKIWLTGCLLICPKSSNNSNIASKIFQKLFRHDSTNSSLLSLTNQSICFNKLVSHYSSFENISLNNVAVKCADGSNASIEMILSIFTKIKYFYYGFGENSESFDIEKFYEFLKKNTNIKGAFSFSPLISEEYQNRLEAIVDKLLEPFVDSEEYVPFAVTYLGQNHQKKEILYEKLLQTFP
uniref:Uncharacterized protein n=1 Tax=Panagrolaimus sp. ES5 TaxID=591445 RepID=A0AC34F5Z8_9BILA